MKMTGDNARFTYKELCLAV